jgi:hypothetical protein
MLRSPDAIMRRAQQLPGEATQIPYAVNQDVRIHYRIEVTGNQ